MKEQEVSEDELINYIKENGYRLSIAILSDMSSMIYYNKAVTDPGIMGFSFKIEGKKIKSFQWLKGSLDKNKYRWTECEGDDFLLHHTITAITSINVDRLSKLLGGE
ncbi:MAG: hypothetical protein QW416_08450 [Candidatus Nitrosocaldaceae archaeon]